MYICNFESALAATLPARTYATEAPRRGLKLVPKAKALELPYLALNSKFATNYLVFDIDRAGAAFAHEDAGLPQPTYTVVNPQNAHAHLVYQVGCIWHREGDEKINHKALALARLLQATFACMLDACPGYTGLIAKNPLHDQWRTIRGPVYSLDELAEYLPQDMTRSRAEQGRRRARTAMIEAGASRNVALFDQVRFEAYARAKTFESAEEARAWTLERCDSLNTNGLPTSEIRATAKSIAKYTWINRHRFTGRPRLTPEQIKERQQTAAETTNTKRSTATAAKVEAAIAELEGRGGKATQADVATLAGVSVRTVRGLLKKRQSAPPLSDSYAAAEPPAFVAENSLAVASVPAAAVVSGLLRALVVALAAAGVQTMHATGSGRLYAVTGRGLVLLPQDLWTTALDQVEAAAHLPELWRYMAFCTWFEHLADRPPP